MLENPFIIVYGVSKPDTVKRLLDCIPHDCVVETTNSTELDSYRLFNPNNRVVIVCKIKTKFDLDPIKYDIAKSHRHYKLAVIYHIEDSMNMSCPIAIKANFVIVCTLVNKEFNEFQRINNIHLAVYSEDSDFTLI